MYAASVLQGLNIPRISRSPSPGVTTLFGGTDKKPDRLCWDCSSLTPQNRENINPQWGLCQKSRSTSLLLNSSLPHGTRAASPHASSMCVPPGCWFVRCTARQSLMTVVRFPRRSAPLSTRTAPAASGTVLSMLWYSRRESFSLTDRPPTPPHLCFRPFRRR